METINEEMSITFNTVNIKGKNIPEDKILNYKDINGLKDLDIILKSSSIIEKEEGQYIICRNVELENNLKKFKPEELTDDLIPTIDTQLRIIKEEEEKQKSKYSEEQKNKIEMVKRVICLSLIKMNLHPLTNTFELNTYDRERLQTIMHSYNDISQEEIVKEFNNKISSEIFDNKQTDFSKLPVYNI